MFEQGGELAGGGIVEGQQRGADRAGGVAEELARGLDRGWIALVFEELAEWPEARPELACGGQVDVFDEQSVQLDALLRDD